MISIIRSTLFLALLLATECAIGQEQITTFILVRHAEKVLDGTSDPELEKKGVARADHLADMLEKTSVDAIYSTAKKISHCVCCGNGKGIESYLADVLKDIAVD